MGQMDIIQGMKEIAPAMLSAGSEALLLGSGANFDKYAYPFMN